VPVAFRILSFRGDGEKRGGDPLANTFGRSCQGRRARLPAWPAAVGPNSFLTRRRKPYTKVLYHPSGADGGLFVKKVPALRMLVDGEPLAAIDLKLPRSPEDLVIVKNYRSPFFGTSLNSTEIGLGIDTLILIGCSTSGCVRAGAIDALHYGYRLIVPRECVGDRHDGPHDTNLFVINAKYGDVIAKADVIGYL
jgi:maleamate amidohydrolase